MTSVARFGTVLRCAVLSIGLAVLLTAAPVAQPPGRPSIAITIDDLPWVGATAPGESRLGATDRLLTMLVRRSVPATGFVVCGRAEPADAILRRWIERGLSLGNHTTRHVSLDRMDVEAWLADVRSCDEYLRRELRVSPVHFRYPQLRQGATKERRDAAAAGVAKMGYANGIVSIDTAEYILAAAYGRALIAGDKARQREILDAYYDHMLAAVGHYREVARQKVGHDIAHVLLLHANALAADGLDAILAALEADGFRFSTLEQALADPVYARPDEYIGEWGVSWLHRIAPVNAADSDWDRHQTRTLEQRFPPAR